MIYRAALDVMLVYIRNTRVLKSRKWTHLGLAAPWLIWTLAEARPSGPFPIALVSNALTPSSKEKR